MNSNQKGKKGERELAAILKSYGYALKGKPPKAGNGGDKPSMTKEQILAVKNPSERQKLIAENITLFQ